MKQGAMRRKLSRRQAQYETDMKTYWVGATGAQKRKDSGGYRRPGSPKQ